MKYPQGRTAIDTHSENPPNPRSPDDSGLGAVTHVRGSTVNVFRTMLEEELGSGAWTELIASLSPESRRIFEEGIGAYTWVPVAAVVELEEAIPRGTRAADAALRGSTAAEQHLTVTHRWLLNLLSVETVLRQSSLLFRFYCKGGRAWLEEIGHGEARVAFQTEGMYPEYCSATLPSYLKRLLELSGAAAVTVLHEPPAPGSGEQVHRYRVAWRE